METEHGFNPEVKPQEEAAKVNTYSTKINTTIGRYALSKNICRFELPIDMMLFESNLFLYCVNIRD
jgi:hypothetical protein